MKEWFAEWETKAEWMKKHGVKDAAWTDEGSLVHVIMHDTPRLAPLTESELEAIKIAEDKRKQKEQEALAYSAA